jgi:farnesyl-diphosphate farnesyltransferase
MRFVIRVLTSSLLLCLILSATMARMSNELLTVLLKDVSRSFYLTLRVLPGKIRAQIGLAYLLARTTDTIADTGVVPVEQRLRALQLLRDRIMGQTSERLDFGELARNQGSPAERVLLQKCESSLALLGSLSAGDAQLIRAVLDIITSGQELDLRRFANASKEHIVALRTEDELDDYIYRVAGCVGEFWTKMCRNHLFATARLEEAALLAKGIRFGKGLQLVNILRDIPPDLRQGRCYLPGDGLAAIGLRPAELLDAANEPRLQPLYFKYLDLAAAHLRAGWEYTNMLPRPHARVRLACAWPILIGMKTLELLRSGKVLDAQRRIKLERAEIKRIIARTVLLYPFSAAWRNLARRTGP